MDFSSTPIDKLIEYQLALSNIMRAAAMAANKVDISTSYAVMLELNGKIEQAIKDEQFELDRLKEL